MGLFLFLSVCLYQEACIKELLIATRNMGKVRELKGLLEPMGIAVLSLEDIKDAPVVVEDGKTFRANAAKKAVELACFSGRPVMGEDSGLEVDALDGRPGVYSARYAGEPPDDERNNTRLLQELSGVPFVRRTARYRSAIAFADKDALVDVTEGHCEGIITEERRGVNGFGYDPLFYVEQYKKTFGELPLSIKQALSHRAMAFRLFLKVLERYLIR